MADDLHRVSLTGRCTRDAELRHTPSGSAVLGIRLAYSTRRKNGDNWEDKSNYIDVTVWGNRAESLAKYLTKGKQIGVDGRLEHSEWEATDGTKRSKHEVVADTIVLLGGGDGTGSGGSSSGSSSGATGSSSRYDEGAGSGGSTDDDIPF